MNETIWFRCHCCGYAFSNKKEIAPPNDFPASFRYYFEGGSVSYTAAHPAGYALCWPCAQGDCQICNPDPEPAADLDAVEQWMWDHGGPTYQETPDLIADDCPF